MLIVGEQIFGWDENSTKVSNDYVIVQNAQ